MRAKTINEANNFERDIHPKAALGLGGFNLGKEIWTRKEKFVEDWKNFINKKFLNKTVYGTFGKWSLDNTGVPHFDGFGKYTILVEEIKISDLETKEGLPCEIKFVGKDKGFYMVMIDQEIFIVDK